MIIAALIVFLIAYTVNITTITVLYHRALAHDALRLTALGEWFTKNVGMWLTGIDPKGWVCMHRLHHAHSDTKRDPHSPVNSNVWRVFLDQHKSFEKILAALILGSKKHLKVVSDINFDVHWLNKKQLWWLPLAMHIGIGIALGFAFGSLWLGLGYAAGMASHPIQGWLVNSFGHASGYTNYDLGDNSKNNVWVALTVVGEGYQNNHHRFPQAAKFSVKWYEFDPGYLMVLLLVGLGFVQFPATAPKSLELEQAANS